MAGYREIAGYGGDSLPWSRVAGRDRTLVLEDNLEALPDPKPPLRTLQRRLQKLVHEGLLLKHGTRKDAFYQVGERT